jgi:hypothetical protein
VGKIENGWSVSIPGVKEKAILECASELNIGQEVLARIRTTDRRGVILIPELASSAQANRVRYDGAFSQSTPAPLQSFRFKRIFDLIPPAPATEEISGADLAALEQFICQVEGGLRTTIIKGSCEDRKSRFLMLYYCGRLVGCTYGRRNKPTDAGLPIAEALQLALDDLSVPSTTAQLIDVPEGLMLGLSALYLGEVLEVPASPASELFGQVGAHFQQNQLTGCVVVCDDKDQSVAFLYAHLGNLISCFDVRKQVLCSFDEIRSMIMAGAELTLRVSILPQISRSLGYSMSLLVRTDCQQGTV